MSLSILNNIAALYAQNNLSSSQSNLQNTLNQLSSGSRINSGADDASGLAVADGLHANEMALTQSAQNASSGIGLLQTADGSLSQVTNLLDRAVTLATESANGTLTGAQVSSANQEYQNILSQIGNIGSTSNFNSTAVFSSTATNIVVTDGTSGGLNAYADTIGKLTTASVGTSAGTAVVATTLNPLTTQTQLAVNKQAGQYTVTPTAKTDTLSGTLAITIGSGSTATTINVAVAAGTSTSALKTQLMTGSQSAAFTGAGLSATVNASTGALTINGPTSGATVAANTVTFTGTSLTDSTATTNVGGALGTTAALGAAAGGSLTVSSTTTGTFGGSITLGQGTQTLILNIASGSSFTGLTDPTSIQSQIANQLAAQTTTNFALAADGGSGATKVLNFTGTDSTTAVGVTNTLNRTAIPPAVTGSALASSATGTAATGSLAILGANAGDTFAAGTITLKQGAAAAVNITTTSAILGTPNTPGTVEYQISQQLQGTGITLSVSGTTNPTLTFSGADNASAIVVTSTLADTTTPATTFTPGLGTIGVAPKVGSYITSALGSPTDTYGIGSTIKINNESISLDGMNGAGAVAAVLGDSVLYQTGISASFANNKLTITGPTDGSTLTVDVSALTDVSVAAPAVTSTTGTAGKAPIAGTYTTTAMGTATDTYGSNAILSINGTNVNVSGDTGTKAASDIQTALGSAGITASFNGTNQLVITGNSDGTPLAVTGVGTLTDVSSNATSPLDSANLVQGQSALGSSAITAATTVLTLLHSTDTLSGTLTVAVAGGGTGSLTITSGSNGQSLTNQINQNKSFIAAGITAGYDSTANAVTITGPTGAANTITVTGTVTDSTVSVPGIGADFTANTVSQLTAGTAKDVLTTVTAAIADVAYQRGTLGADINQLSSASNVASSESVNLTSAESAIRATDYGQAASQLSKYQILSQTGISALAQANSVQQEVLKLLQ